MKRTLTFAALATCATLAAVTALPVKSEAGANVICKSMTWGNAKHAVRATAKSIAYNNWKSAAGPGWNNWALATSRSKRCRKQGSDWACVRKGKPCKTLGMKG